VSCAAAGDAFGWVDGRGLLLAGFGLAGVVAGRPAGGAADRRGPVAIALAGALPCCVLLRCWAWRPAPTLALVWLGPGVCSRCCGRAERADRRARRPIAGAVSLMARSSSRQRAGAGGVARALRTDVRLAFTLAASPRCRRPPRRCAPGAAPVRA